MRRNLPLLLSLVIAAPALAGDWVLAPAETRRRSQRRAHRGVGWRGTLTGSCIERH